MFIALPFVAALLGEPAPAPAPAPAPTAELEEEGKPSEPKPEPAAPADADPEGGAEPQEVSEEVSAPSLEGQPLPEAPARVDPGTLERDGWRGKGFFQIHIAAMVPLGGERPGAGTVVSAGGGVQLGWRLHRVLALGVGLTTFLHDHGESLAVDSAGETVEVRDFGRLTLFDPVFARFFVPTRRKVEPRFDIGPLLGSYRPPFDGGPSFVGGVRFGAGLDVWIGPAFSLDFGVDPRIVVIEGTAGVTLQAGMGASVHW